MAQLLQKAYTRLVSGVLFPLHERVKRHTTVAIRRGMEDSQWWLRERLEALRIERLRALLWHAQQFVPYYRDRFGELGLNAPEVRDISILQRLPLLSKADIRAHLEQLRSERAVDLARFNTGGSSGEPLVFLVGRERVSHDVAAKWRATRWWGVDIGDPEIVVWGSPIELGAQDRMRSVRDRLLRTRLLPAFEMSKANLDKFVAAIRKARPAMLFGYPSSLALIARYAEQRGTRMDDLGIRVAFVTSEKLHDHQREAIARIFGCTVANGYGGRDAGFIAHECPAGGMHITAEDIIVETVGPEGFATAPGEPGEIVVTHLATKDFPFIRYRTGDIGVLEDRACPCGRGLPLLGDVQGRTTDFVVAADGTTMHGLALIYVLRDTPGIEAFKIIQESLSLTRVLLVPGAGYGDATRRRIEEGLKARLGKSVNVLVVEVARIDPERSGKFRYVVSEVAQQSPLTVNPGASATAEAR
jgi:phenylacetate-CoA ligase